MEGRVESFLDEDVIPGRHGPAAVHLGPLEQSSHLP